MVSVRLRVLMPPHCAQFWRTILPSRHAPSVAQPAALRTPLRAYQLRAVRWMLDRERAPGVLTNADGATPLCVKLRDNLWFTYDFELTRERTLPSECAWRARTCACV
jgi:hypothetical protein